MTAHAPFARAARTAASAGALALALAIVMVPSPASADPAPDPTLVNVLGCQLLEGGSTSVPTGSDVTLRLPGFAEGNYGLARMAVDSATATVTLTPTDRPAVRTDVTSTFAITELSRTFVVARPANLDIGPLDAGESVQVLYELHFSHPVSIAYPPVGPSGDNGPYLTDAEDDVTCTITASSG